MRILSSSVSCTLGKDERRVSSNIEKAQDCDVIWLFNLWVGIIGVPLFTQIGLSRSFVGFWYQAKTVNLFSFY